MPPDEGLDQRLRWIREFEEQSRDAGPAISAPYATPQPNEPIELYRGPAEFFYDAGSMAGDANLVLQWLPSPELMFRVESDARTGWLIPFGELSLSDIGIRVPARVLEAQGDMEEDAPSGTEWISGRTQQVEIDGDVDVLVDDLAYVVFHVPNLAPIPGSLIKDDQGRVWPGRHVLNWEDWRITLDSVPGVFNLADALTKRGGYAITHVGRLERPDSQPFSVGIADLVLNALSEALSFSQGLHIPYLLPVGYTAAGQPRWQDWRMEGLSPWSKVYSWFPTKYPEALDTIFNCFMVAELQEQIASTIGPVVGWYVGASLPSGVLDDVAFRQILSNVVVQQVELELLAWTSLVILGDMSKSDFRNLLAADRLRRLLKLCEVPVDVPPEYEELRSAAEARGWVDAPHALTAIRNNVVHPSREQISNDMALDAYWLGAWYTELALLHLVRYEGWYEARVGAVGQGPGRLERVPWSKT